MPPSFAQLLGWYIAKWLRPVFGFVMAAHIIIAAIALPKWKVLQILPMWVNFFAISKPRFNIFLAAHTENLHLISP